MSTGNYSATEMQSVGQTSAHDPQSVQRSASILYTETNFSKALIWTDVSCII